MPDATDAAAKKRKAQWRKRKREDAARAAPAAWPDMQPDLEEQAIGSGMIRVRALWSDVLPSQIDTGFDW